MFLTTNPNLVEERYTEGNAYTMVVEKLEKIKKNDKLKGCLSADVMQGKIK
jgi:hypothetical protein